MRTYLIRHAEAVGESATVPDWQRFLTDEGRRRARGLGEAIAASLGASPGPAGADRGAVARVVTSPLVRAVQTAELVAAAIGYGGVVETMAHLAPRSDVCQAAALLRGCAGVVIAVGHEPALSALGGLLVDGRPLPGLRKAQAGCIEGGRPAFVLSAGDPAPAPWEP